MCCLCRYLVSESSGLLESDMGLLLFFTGVGTAISSLVLLLAFTDSWLLMSSLYTQLGECICC